MIKILNLNLTKIGSCPCKKPVGVVYGVSMTTIEEQYVAQRSEAVRRTCVYDDM